jgi:hypothetical protein
VDIVHLWRIVWRFCAPNAAILLPLLAWPKQSLLYKLEVVAGRGENPDPNAYVTLGGIPLRFGLEWPFHRSTSGADWYVLHGRATLLSDPNLHADFAANFTETIVEALPSLGPEHAESVAINAVRMWADAGRMEFLKSGKRLPVEVSSRYLDFKTNTIRFLSVKDSEIQNFVQTKLYWLSHRAEQKNARIWIADPHDSQYLGCEAEKLIVAAKKLGLDGFCKVEGEFAGATEKVASLEADMKEQLQKTLDRAVAKFNQALIG